MNLDAVPVLGVIGDINFGKTSLCYTLLSQYEGERQIVLYSYPDTVLNEKTGEAYRQIHTIQELELLTNSIIFMDELQKHIKFYDKRMNNQLLEILSTIAHNNNTLIFTTPMTQFITKALDCFITGFCYVRISDMDQMKNGSKVKRLLQDFSTDRRGTRTLRLERGEYLQVVEGQEDTNGLHAFSNPLIRKAWKVGQNAHTNAQEKPKEMLKINTSNVLPQEVQL